MTTTTPAAGPSIEMAPTTPVDLAATLRTIATEVNDLYLERKSAIDAIMLGILAKEHVFILGPPGTGKSALCREIIARFLGATYFETLLSKTRPDQAVLGPYDLPKLRDKGEFVRRITGYLPEANFAFIDEAGKMSPTLGHDMLAILNERILHQVTDGQRSTLNVPLYSALTASNELIVQESEDAAALWDRLLVRVVVDHIQESGAFHALLQMDDTPVSRTTLPFDLLAHAIDVDVPAVKVPAEVIDLVLELREQLRAAEITVSDRRWRACTRLLRAAAFYAGRDTVVEDDVQVLRYALWDGPEQKSTVERTTLQVANPLAEKLMTITDELEEFARRIRAQKGKSTAERANVGVEINGKLQILVREIESVATELSNLGRTNTAVIEVNDRLKTIKKQVLSDLLGVDD